MTTWQLLIGIGFLLGAAVGWLAAGRYHTTAHLHYLRLGVWWEQQLLRLALWWRDSVKPWLRGLVRR